MIKKFLELAISLIGCGYVFGSQGQIMTAVLLSTLIKTFGISHYEFTDSAGKVNANKWIGKQCFDCSGLIVWILQNLGLVATNKDYTASSIYSSLCVSITKDKLLPGDLVFIKNSSGRIDHVGIYAGDGKTIEAIGTRKGVVLGDAGRFNVYGRLKFFKDEIENPAPMDMTYEQALKVVAEKAGTSYAFWFKKKDIDPAFPALIIKIAKAWR